MWHSQKIKSYLEVSTNIAVLFVAIVALVFALNYYRAARSITQLQSGLHKEITLSPLTGVNYGDARQTLLIAMNTRCKYCIESVPFYNQLADLQRNNTKAISVIAIFPNADDEVRQYVKQWRLAVPTIAAVDFQKLNLAGTPTMILVSNQGRILDFWIGKLSAEDEQQVIQRING